MTNKKGFTLIELLIVIAIIGILAAALIPNILNAPAAARDTARISAVNDIVTALEQYYSANSSYPTTSNCVENLANFTQYFKTGAPKNTVTTAINGINAGAACQYTYYKCPAGSNFSYAVIGGMEKAGGDKAKFTNLVNSTTACTSIPTLLTGTNTSTQYYILN